MESLSHDKLLSKQVQIFTPTSQMYIIYRLITAVSIVYWIFLIIKYYFALITADSVESSKSLYGFMPYFTVIVLYPILYYIKQFMITNPAANVSVLSMLNPFYPICFQGQISLTKKELSTGAVGKVDYKCLKNQTEYLDVLPYLWNIRFNAFFVCFRCRKF